MFYASTTASRPLYVTRHLRLPFSFLVVYVQTLARSSRVQPPVVSRSFGAGHAGVACDIELLQQGWLEARGADSAIYEQVCRFNIKKNARRSGRTRSIFFAATGAGRHGACLIISVDLVVLLVLVLVDGDGLQL